MALMNLKFDNASLAAAMIADRLAVYERGKGELQRRIDALLKKRADEDREIERLSVLKEKIAADAAFFETELLDAVYAADPLKPRSLAYWWWFWGFRPSNRLPPRCPADCI